MTAESTFAPAVETPSIVAPTGALPAGEAAAAAAPSSQSAAQAAADGASAAPSANGNSRDTRGRFAAGNPGGPGNPFARQVAALRQAVLDSVTPADMQTVVRKLIELAAAGNVPAARLLLSYALGKPQPFADPDRMDAAEWEVHKETANMLREAPALTLQAEPWLPLGFVRGIRPIVTKIHREKLADMFEHPEKLLGPRHSEEFLRSELERISTTRAAAPPGWVGHWPVPVEAPPPVAAVGRKRGRRPSTNGANGRVPS